MKQLITILLCLITFFAEAQVNTNDTNKYFKSYDYGFSYRRLQAREAFIMPTDTVINKLGAVSLNGAIYLGNGIKWTSIGGGGSSTDTTSLSNRINLKLNISDTLNMLNPYLRKIDTTNKFVNTLTRTPGKDSIIFFVGGNRFAIKDSVGGGGTTPTLQQVTDAGSTTTNTISVTGLNIGSAGSQINLAGSTGNLTIANTGTSDEILNVSNGVNGYLKFGGGAGQYAQFNVPNAGNSELTIPQGNGTIPLSVNGNTADVSGNITISAGGVAVDTIFRTLGKDSIFYKKNNITYAIKDSVGTNPAPVGYYGAFQDTTTQTAVSINTAYGVRLGVTDLSNGVTIANNTRIKIANAGIYNIQFSLQLEKTGGSGNMIADIWLRKNGVNLDGTTGKVVLTGSANASPIVAAWNYLVAVASNDSLELMWSTTNDNVIIKASPATSPFPSIPSAILTVTQQSGIMAGTGISPLDTANMLSNYARTNLVNTKLNISDTTAFQRKSIPSYTFLANNTTATANAQALPFKDTSGVYTGSIVYNNGTAPTSGNLSYRWTRIGKMVTINISLVYANAGSSNTSITIALPSDAPTPTKPAGLTSASNLLYPCYGNVNATNQSTLSNSSFRGSLRNNSSNNGFEFFVNHGITTPINVFVTCTYFTD